MHIEICEPRISAFSANGEENNRRLVGENMNPSRRMFTSDVIVRSVTSHMWKVVESRCVVERKTNQR